ncbi:uncharacterized protein LOC126834792 [Adelges cooleyi]|uniref:uncharacterized protein LOC126834792 n=1 Tax=Adelges cooleyi TaxID=133065 RepID=UPI0021808988|nr:uncharacterized protein LOC126834792 [Adelges cooleyi]
MANASVFEELRLVLRPDDADRRIVCIEETETAKGDIITAFYLWYILNKTDRPVLMFGVRDAFGHYHNVGLKYNYNLLSMANKKRFQFVEPEHSIRSWLDPVEKLMEKCPNETLYLIVDDLSVPLLLGETVENIVAFLTYVRKHQSIVLIFACWKHKVDDATKRLAAVASHLSDVKIALAPLPTGFSNAATGTMRITSYKTMFDMSDISYLYKLSDNGLSLTLNK